MASIRLCLSNALAVGLIVTAIEADCRGQDSPGGVADPIFDYQEVMIPMRDGVRLQTVILTPITRLGPLPILLRRSPYGVPDKAPTSIPDEQMALARDGYIFVTQNVRGRFKSQGVFSVSTLAGTSDPNAVNDTTDALRYDRLADQKRAQQQRQSWY